MLNIGDQVMELKTEERRLVIEIILTLVHIKRAMVEFILTPAGVPKEIYHPLIYKLDETTGHPLSKRRDSQLACPQKPPLCSC